MTIAAARRVGYVTPVTPNSDSGVDYPNAAAAAACPHPRLCDTSLWWPQRASSPFANCHEASPLPIRGHDLPQRVSAVCRGTDGGEAAAAHPGRIVGGMDDLPGIFLGGSAAGLCLCALDLGAIHPGAPG